jgi:hypothetical protein
VPPFINLLGQRFGRLLVTEFVRIDGRPFWKCQCDCGRTTIKHIGQLRGIGATRSCGCLIGETARKTWTTHGRTNTPEYKIWNQMIQRCTNPNDPSYKNYGGHGINVYEGWVGQFMAWLAEAKPRPSPKHTLERIDNDKGYVPGNIKWATRREQLNNTRRNHHITVNGETLTLTQAAAKLGLTVAAIFGRVKRGWTDEEIMAHPLGTFRPGSRPFTEAQRIGLEKARRLLAAKRAARH